MIKTVYYLGMMPLKVLDLYSIIINTKIAYFLNELNFFNVCAGFKEFLITHLYNPNIMGYIYKTLGLGTIPLWKNIPDFDLDSVSIIVQIN